MGCSGVKITEVLAELERRSRRHVLVLVDGLGARFLNRSTSVWLRDRVVEEVSTTVPSTTTCAIASLSTGSSPAVHGLLGYSYVVNSAVVRPLSWSADERSGKSLSTPKFGSVEYKAIVPYSHLASGFSDVVLGANRESYSLPFDMNQVVELVSEALRHSDNCYLYLGDLDATLHAHGCNSEEASNSLGAIESTLKALRSIMPKGVDLYSISDHGHVDITNWHHVSTCLPEGTMLAGEPRFRYLYLPNGSDIPGVRADLVSKLGSGFRIETGQEMARLFPDCGHLIKIGLIIASLGNGAIENDQVPFERGQLSGHGSVTDDEILVPLLLCN
jgi:Type I phosphodiesterase / nucleotide pyrophosphatase